MTEERIQAQMSQLIKQVDKDEYPEIAQMLFFFQDDDGSFIIDEETEIVDNLFNCDKTKPLPPEVAKFMEEIYLDEIADNNFAAANDLGALYYTGRIGVQDYTKAMHYYEIAAKGGNRQAQENLGYCYYYGRNCEKDYKKAFHYFALGAFDGHLRSLYKIGDMYLNGYYVEKNEREAKYIYRRCYEMMTDAARPLLGADVAMRLGDFAFEGICEPPDYGLAIHFYQEAEQLFYQRLMDGDFLIKHCYEKVIARQNEAREKLKEELPDYSWTAHE